MTQKHRAAIDAMNAAGEALKPCPFCGSTNLKTGGDDKIVGVWCLTCQAAGPNHYGSREWNDRVSAIGEGSRVIEALEAAKELAKVAEGLTGCRADDDFVWGVQAKIDTALSALSSPRQPVEPVGWETEAEWELEQRAFHWNERWTTEETRALINDLWQQYCLAADPDRRDAPEPVALPADATPGMVKAALSVDWSNENEEATVHNVWHAMISALPASSPIAWLYCGHWGEYLVYEKKDTAPGAYYKPLYASPPDVELVRMRTALESIAKNTCCDGCQEAALVARAALPAKEAK
jgi:hypothetical protein